MVLISSHHVGEGSIRNNLVGVELDCVCSTLISGFILLMIFCFILYFFLSIGADPTLKDNSGYQAIEYAENAKIKEFLNEKMDTVTEL